MAAAPTGGSQSPADRQEFEAWEDWYARQDYRRMPWFSPHPSPWLVRAVRERWIPRAASVLDIGCGAGTNVIWLRKQGLRASGVDLSSTAIAIASARARRSGVRADFRVADAARLPYPSGAFSAALDTGCFHSLPMRSRASYSQEVYRVLRAGSPFLLTWIPREVRSEIGPPHRPSLAETASVFEPRFLFSIVDYQATGSPRGWKVCGEPFGRCTALLRRRRGRQPPAW